MDPRKLFGISAVLMSASVFVHSLNTANAFPQGPNISLGSNPIYSISASCNNASTMYTNNTTQTFIITDVVLSVPNGGYSLTLEINGQTIWSMEGNAHLKSGIPIASGATLKCSGHGGYNLNLSGYHTH